MLLYYSDTYMHNVCVHVCSTEVSRAVTVERNEKKTRSESTNGVSNPW